MLHLTANDYIQ